ncbi:MAG: response regulator, partial [Desulfurivibrionaceae bacterium]
MGKKIFVVDNHPMVLRLIANLLEKDGHEVRTAKDGLGALDILRSYVPD